MTREELVEAVARAICTDRCPGNCHVCDFDHVKGHCKPHACYTWPIYTDAARAALDAVAKAAGLTAEDLPALGDFVEQFAEDDDEPLSRAAALLRALAAPDPAPAGGGDAGTVGR